MLLMTYPTTKRSPGQAGMSLIEVLVTVLVLSVGLLGIAALQFVSKRSNFEALQRTTATMLAYDILERMRANPGVLETYAANQEASIVTPMPNLDGYEALGEPSPDCKATACNATQLTDHDKWEWVQTLLGAAEVSGGANTGGLVSPTACLISNVPDVTTPDNVPSERSGQYMVAIAWRGQTAMSNPVNPTLLASPDPYICGADTGKYDNTAGDNVYRRVLTISTYIKAF